MIRGVVTSEKEPILSLRVSGPLGTVDLKAVIDTGFNDCLALSAKQIELLGLPFEAKLLATLADGEDVETSSYNCTVFWDGQQLEALVIECDGGPLVGMSMLYGHHLHIEAVDGGLVTIERRV
jgi:predicted aspartyl protease